MQRRTLRALAAMALVAGTAHASPNISIAYLQPSGTAWVDAPIEVWVQVSTDREISDDFGAPFGFDASDLPRTTMVTDWFSDVPREAEFGVYSGLGIYRGYSCTPSCDVPGYTFSGVVGDRPDGYTAWLGETVRSGIFLLGTYTPDGTHVSGHIAFPVVPILAFRLYGGSTTGENLVSHVGPKGGFTPCSNATTSECSFTRNVMAVPELSAWSMMLLGLVVLSAGRFARTRP